MRLFSPLTFRIAEAIGMAAAGAAGGAGAHHLYSKSKNEATPSAQVKMVDPFLEGKKLNKDQIEVSKFLWKRDMSRELIDYQDRVSWVQKAKDYSVKSNQWPGDIIFIEDKSDASLAGLLRDKCYTVSRWFPNKQDQSLDDKNEHLKAKFKNAKDSFTLENLKELCSTGQEDKKDYKISNVKLRGLDGLLQEHGSYTCHNSTVPKGHWMEEIYKLKKDRTTKPDACTIVKSNIIVEITYNDRPKKYEIRKSQVVENDSKSNYISVPRDDWAFYSSLEELPGFNQMFKKNSR